MTNPLNWPFCMIILKTLGLGISLVDFLRTELTRGYHLENDEKRFSARREKVYSFITIPKEIEKFMTYGFLQVSFLLVTNFK